MAEAFTGRAKEKTTVAPRVREKKHGVVFFLQTPLQTGPSRSAAFWVIVAVLGIPGVSGGLKLFLSSEAAPPPLNTPIRSKDRQRTFSG